MVFLIYVGCIAVFMILAKIVQSVIIRHYGKKPREIFTFLAYLIFGVCGQLTGIAAVIQFEVPRLITRSAHEAKLMIRSANPGVAFIEEGIDIETLLTYEDIADQILDVSVNIVESPETMSAQLKQIYRFGISNIEDNAFTTSIITTWVIDLLIDLFREQIYAEVTSSLNRISPNIDIRDILININSYQDAERPIAQILNFSVDENGKVSLFSIIDKSAEAFNTGIYLKMRQRQIHLLLIVAIYTGVLLAGVIVTLPAKKRHIPTVEGTA